MAGISKFLNRPLVLQYKHLVSNSLYKNEIFNILRTTHAEKFCKKTMNQVGFALSKECMEKLKDRDIAVIKQFFQMYCKLITENIDENVEDLPRLWLNKTTDFLMQFVHFLDSSEFCSESVYWKQCTDINKHTPNVYTCVNFQNCMMVTVLS